MKIVHVKKVWQNIYVAVHVKIGALCIKCSKILVLLQERPQGGGQERHVGGQGVRVEGRLRSHQLRVQSVRAHECGDPATDQVEGSASG